ncbi:MAG: CpsB/CapC family capsule biosynthesis tyrosine phosphatase [Anaerostipes hadrus]
MIDIHTHILPGLDDGARDMEDSLSMAALALKSGVHTLVATSHANTGGFFKEYSIEEYLQRLEAFRKALDEVKLPLRVFSGMEIYMTREVPRMIREGRLLSLNQTGYFLTEFSFGIEQEEMDEMLHDLMELGVTPVIAHPERYRCVQESESGIAKWKNRGCLLQVNRGSIFGRFGSGAKQCVDRLLDQHMVTCIASDAHKPYERTTYMADIKEYMEQEYSFEYSKKLLYDNPKRILEEEKRWYNEEIKIGKFCDILYITGSKSDLLVYTGQKRRPDRTGHYNGSAGIDSRAQCYR